MSNSSDSPATPVAELVLRTPTFERTIHLRDASPEAIEDGIRVLRALDLTNAGPA